MLGILKFNQTDIRKCVFAGIVDSHSDKVMTFCADSQSGIKLTGKEIGNEKHDSTPGLDTIKKSQCRRNISLFALWLEIQQFSDYVKYMIFSLFWGNVHFNLVGKNNQADPVIIFYCRKSKQCT